MTRVRPGVVLAFTMIFGVAAVLAVTSQTEVRSESLEAVVRESANDRGPRPSLLAATDRNAVLITETVDGGVTFEFVGPSGEKVAYWQSHRSAVPRLVCAGCPRPIVGDSTGFYGWSGMDWQLTDLPIQESSFADPLASTFGVVQEIGARVSLAMVVGMDGRYQLVRDGGDAPNFSPTGIGPEAGEFLDLAGGPGQVMAPLSVVRDLDGSITGVQSEPLSAGAISRVTRAHGGAVQEQTFEGGAGVPTSNSAPCLRLSPGAPSVVQLSTRLSGTGIATRPPSVVILWLSSDLQEVARAETEGFYDHCVSLQDGTALLWTGTTAGLGAVDVASVSPQGSVRRESVAIAENALVSTLALRGADSGTLLAWPLGGQARQIDRNFETIEAAGLGGNQILQDDEGGTWVLFSAVHRVIRVPKAETR